MMIETVFLVGIMYMNTKKKKIKNKRNTKQDHFIPRFIQNLKNIKYKSLAHIY